MRSATLLVLLLLTGTRGILFALVVPLGQGPDEPGHVAHALLYARQREVRVVGRGDPGISHLDVLGTHMFWESAVREDRALLESIFGVLRASGFWGLVEAPAPSPRTLEDVGRYGLFEYVAPRRYTSPLYFFLVSRPLRWFWMKEIAWQWTVLRLFSVGFGLGVVGFTYGAARRLWREESEGPALAAASFVALLPQFSFLSAVVSPDPLVVLLSAAVLYLACRIVTGGGRWYEVAGVVGGGATCAAVKEHGLGVLVFGLLSLAYALGWTRARHAPAGDRKTLLAILGVGTAAAAALYFFGSPRAAQRVWLLVAERSENFGNTFLVSPASYARLLAIAFVSFWFSYGWAIYKMALGWYVIFGLASAGALIGLVRLALDPGGRPEIDRRCAVLPLMLVALYAGLFVFVLGPRREGADARHLFAALPAIGVLFPLGIWRLSPRAYRERALRALAIFMLFVNVVAVLKYLIPLFYLRT